MICQLIFYFRTSNEPMSLMRFHLRIRLRGISLSSSWNCLKRFPLNLWHCVVTPSHVCQWKFFCLLDTGDILCSITLGMRLRTKFSLFPLRLILEASIIMKKRVLWESDWCEFEFCLLHLLALWLWASYVSSSNLSFFIYKGRQY